MKLTKQKVCVFIENEAQLQEAKELLENYGEKVAKDGTFKLTNDNENYLNLYIDNKWFLCSNQVFFNQITLSELEEILKNEAK